MPLIFILVIAAPEEVAPTIPADLAAATVTAKLSARRLLRSPSIARECAAAALTRPHAHPEDAEDRATLTRATDHLTPIRAAAADPTGASEEDGAQDLATERDHGAARDLALERDPAPVDHVARDHAAEAPERL